MNKISVIESWKFGWNVFKKNWKILIYATAVSFLIETIMGVLFKVDDLKKDFWIVSSAMTLVSIYYVLRYLLQTLFSIGQTKINLTASFGGEEKPKFSDLFNSQGVYLKYLITSILFSLVVIGGCILLVIPGIYLALRYCFAPILILDKKIGIEEAFAKSKEMTAGVKWKLIGFFVVSAIFILLGLIAIGVGIIITFIIFELAFVHLYKTLLNKVDERENGGQMDFEDVKNVEEKLGELQAEDTQKEPENDQKSENPKIVENQIEKSVEEGQS